MGIFDVFKRKKSLGYDPADIKVTDMSTGFMFEYNLETWTVVKTYDYDWGGGYYSLEFLVENESATESYYFSVEHDDELELSFSKKIRLRSIGEDIPEYIIEHETPPKSLLYQGTKYFLENESMGSMRERGVSGFSNLISWDYYSEDGKFCICIEQWGEREFEASHGFFISESDIMGILPVS